GHERPLRGEGLLQAPEQAVQRAHHRLDLGGQPLVGDRVEPSLVASPQVGGHALDRKSTRLNSSHVKISYAVFCLKKKRGSTALRGCRASGCHVINRLAPLVARSETRTSVCY